MANLKLVIYSCLLGVWQLPTIFSQETYPDCNFSDGFRGWNYAESGKDNRYWMIINSSTVENLGTLTGRQGAGDSFAITKWHVCSSYCGWRYDRATLYSKEITGPVCMKFFFYLHGNKTGHLKILTKRVQSSYENVVFTRYGNNGHKWNLAQIYLDFSPYDVYQIIIRAEIGDPTINLAIDDISFKNETCEQLPPGYKCDSSLFLCDNGECISNAFVCDGDIKCADGSDEKYCQCLITQVKCKTSGECIDSRLLCNDKRDCKDGSDEKSCHKACDSKQVYCPSGICILFNSTCDGIWNCPDGADEPSICGKQTKLVRNVTLCDEVFANADNIDNACESSIISDCHSTLRCHRMTSNKTKVYVDAVDLLVIPSYFPESTAVIIFDNNFLVKLDADNFQNLSKLEYLSFSNNKITVLDKDTFNGLTSIKTLRLPINFITEIPKSLFLETRSLETLDLGMNWIKLLDTDLFSTLNNLHLLSLRMNLITSLDDEIFSELRNLQYLYLDGNEIAKMGRSVFDNLSLLKALILKNNKLEVVKASWLRGKKHLQILDIGNNNIKEIEPGAFDDLENLEKLDISNNHLQSIPEYLFQPLVSLRDVRVDHFTLCCYAQRNKPWVNCVFKGHDCFSSCDELLRSTVLKYSIWILGIMAFAGNLVVIIWRSVAKDSNGVNSFLLTNLAVADFLMGAYMLIIAYKDTAWDGEYFKHDVAWRASNLCIFAGVISTVSSEVSVLTLTVITLDRFVCIVFPFRFQRWTMKKASAIVSFVWMLGFCISLAPLLYDQYFYDYIHNAHFFGRSAVCLPLQLSSERPSGWQYSVSVFLFLNGTSFLFILLAYLFMYRTVVKAASAVRSTRMNQDSTLAKRMMFIILTDFLCWFPVIIISALALTGNLHDPSQQVYSWIAVFVLPINSSINPLLYTFSTPYFCKKIATARKALSIKRRRQQKASHRQFSSENSLGLSHDTINTMATPVGTPQSLRRLKIVNETYIRDDNITESSFTESASSMEYFIRMVQDFELFTDKDKIKKSYLAIDGEERPCLLHVYKSENEESWKKTTNVLSWLSLDNGHDNIVSFLWSAKANKVLVENAESFKTKKLEQQDYVVCYELLSKLTLDEFLKIDTREIPEETVYCILYDLIRAIDYLSSKQVVHRAILPENIILVQSAEHIVESTVLGGLHAAELLMPSSEDHQINDGSTQQIMQELEMNVKSFGNIIKILLMACPAAEKFREFRDIMVSCLSEKSDSKPTTPDLLKRLASMGSEYPPSDKVS